MQLLFHISWLRNCRYRLPFAQLLKSVSNHLKICSRDRLRRTSCSACPNGIADGFTVTLFSRQRVAEKEEGLSFPFFSRRIAAAARLAFSSLSAAKASALPISWELREGLERLGVRRLAAVQRVCLLRALGGKSLAVAAPPGAGKTLAYLLPVMQRFIAQGKESGKNVSNALDPAVRNPFGLVLVPSRELARQVASVALALAPHAPLLLLDPAAPLHHHQQQLQHLSAKLLIATPDRILALRGQQRAAAAARAAGAAAPGKAIPLRLALEKLRIIVIDEADSLLRQGYLGKVREIYRAATKAEGEEGWQPGDGSVQLLAFSAVLPERLIDTLKTEFPHAEVLDMLGTQQQHQNQEQKRTAANTEDLESFKGGLAAGKGQNLYSGLLEAIVLACRSLHLRYTLTFEKI